ncbi:hypothetical protein BJ742DRAFT_860691 [Cladochytrium replicatum]|nr:hypothetical protein BJ742DRAFT_860691 [Cladochytrium replicatum]
MFQVQGVHVKLSLQSLPIHKEGLVSHKPWRYKLSFGTNDGGMEKSAKRTSSTPKVPLMAFVGTFLLAVLIIATVPTSVIVFTTSLSSVDTLADEIIGGVVHQANNELLHILNGISASTLLFINAKAVRSFIPTNTRGYGRNVDFNYIAIQLLNSTQGLIYVGCAPASNLTGEVSPQWNQPFLNSTMYGVTTMHSVTPGVQLVTANYFDYTNPTFMRALTLDSSTGDPIGPFLNITIPSIAFVKSASVYWMLERKQYGPYWLAEIVNSQPRFTYAATSAPMNVTNIFGETQLTVPYGCAATMLMSDVTALLRGIQPTSNTRIYLTNGENLLIATNTNISTITVDFKRFIPISNATDPYISEIGSIFQTPVDNIQEHKTQDGTQWMLATRALKLAHEGSTFMLTVAIPRMDFFETVETSIRRGIVITAVTSALGLLLALVVVVLIVTPIKRMINNMAKATKFEFSALEESLKVTRPSIFNELRLLQETFAVMVRTFAEAIQRNKSLVERRTSQSVTGTGSFV